MTRQAHAAIAAHQRNSRQRRHLRGGASRHRAGLDWLGASELEVNREEEEAMGMGMGEPHRTANQRIAHRRRLLDTFGDSLVFVNNLYTKRFDKKTQRKVPAHMPHFIDRRIIEEAQAAFPKEWEATSKRRFRSSQDMQYGFSYFYYLIESLSEKDVDWEYLWARELDVDNNGVLDENEILTVAAMVKGKEPTDNDITKTRECLTDAAVELSGTRRITFAALVQCEKAVTGLRKFVKKRKSDYVIDSKLADVAFEMIGDNYNDTKLRLDSIRARKSKFVCVNDDMNAPTVELTAMLQNFYLSFFPHRSQFELPDHKENRYLHVDEYWSAKRRNGRVKQWHYMMLILIGAYLLMTSLASPPGDKSLPEDSEESGLGEASGALRKKRRRRKKASDLKDTKRDN
uniref:EF-hand domain-containing protein n=1 Tax=Octactis speculum TaxID=3111310 RepID=A0A7S2FB28_9STRA